MIAVEQKFVELFERSVMIDCVVADEPEMMIEMNGSNQSCIQTNEDEYDHIFDCRRCLGNEVRDERSRVELYLIIWIMMQ